VSSLPPCLKLLRSSFLPAVLAHPPSDPFSHNLSLYSVCILYFYSVLLKFIFTVPPESSTLAAFQTGPLAPSRPLRASLSTLLLYLPLLHIQHPFPISLVLFPPCHPSTLHRLTTLSTSSLRIRLTIVSATSYCLGLH